MNTNESNIIREASEAIADCFEPEPGTDYDIDHAGLVAIITSAVIRIRKLPTEPEAEQEALSHVN